MPVVFWGCWRDGRKETKFSPSSPPVWLMSVSEHTPRRRNGRVMSSSDASRPPPATCGHSSVIKLQGINVMETECCWWLESFGPSTHRMFVPSLSQSNKCIYSFSGIIINTRLSKMHFNSVLVNKIRSAAIGGWLKQSYYTTNSDINRLTAICFASARWWRLTTFNQ